MVEKVSKSIIIDKAAYMFLDAESRRQRGGKPLTPAQADRLWERVTLVKNHPGAEKVAVTDLSFGGGDGTYEGRWWAWSVETLKKMLTEAGYQFEAGKDFEYIEG